MEKTDNKIYGVPRTTYLVGGIVLTCLFIVLFILTRNYASAAFWVGAGASIALVLITLISPSKLSGLRFLLVAAAMLLPGMLDTTMNIPQEMRPNTAFLVYLLILTWLPLFREMATRRAAA
jgi:hypothetical protein